MISWSDLLAALAIVLVLEGLLPFASPRGVKRTFGRLAELDERQLRIGGLLSMLAGVALLFVVRA